MQITRSLKAGKEPFLQMQIYLLTSVDKDKRKECEELKDYTAPIMYRTTTPKKYMSSLDIACKAIPPKQDHSDIEPAPKSPPLTAPINVNVRPRPSSTLPVRDPVAVMKVSSHSPDKIWIPV